MTDDRRVRGRMFGQVAEEYDRVRPGYPAELVDEVLTYAGDRAGLDALEVGAGTGKATRAFAERGMAIVAVEPDPAMAAVLRRHVDGRPVRVEVCAFEDYRPDRGFGLVFSASAWHWTDPGSRYESAARALVPGGVLAVFDNDGRIADPALREAYLSVLAEYAPSVVVHDEPADPGSLLAVWPGSELAQRPEFGDLVGRVYRFDHMMSGADYVMHVSTRSQCRALEPVVRQRLLGALQDLLQGSVQLAVESVCVLARRK